MKQGLSLPSFLHAKLWPRATACVLVILADAASAQPLPPHCGALTNAYGPFDYRNDKSKLPIVEGAHFTMSVEMLIKGNGGYLGGDLDYTLRAFPNHHRALVSMMRYGDRLKATKVPHATYEVECYFLRAVALHPDDTTARMLYVNYLKQQGRPRDALRQLAVTELHAGDNAFTHYNMGLLYLELGEPAAARKHAHIAKAKGFLRADLKDRLVAAGQWMEPAEAAASAPASAAAH
jgi:uncharacterized protein (TIGR02996 family)